MKKHFFRMAAAAVCSLIVIVSVIAPAVPVKADDGLWDKLFYSSFREAWNENIRNAKVGVAGALASTVNGEPWYEGYMMGRVLQTNAAYYNQPSMVFDYVNNVYKDYPSTLATNEPGYYAYQGFVDNTQNAANNNFIDSVENDYSTTNRYEVFQDNSDYSTNHYDYSWYNPITNNYNNCDSFYFDHSTNSYYYETNIGEINYENYVIDNSTHVTYYIVQTDTSSGVEYEFIYDIYYKLPDGRNSYDLLADDVWGEYFVYNIVNYDSVAEDDGTTLGLWHLDGNGNDSSYWNNNTAIFSNISYVDGIFSKGKYVPYGSSNTLYLNKCSFDASSAFTLEWVEYVPKLANTDNIDYLNYLLLPDYYWFHSSGNEDSFAHYALVFDGSAYNLFLNGIKCNCVSYYNSAWTMYDSVDTVCGFSISDSQIVIESSKNKTGYLASLSLTEYVYQHVDTIIDEIRLSKGVLYTDTYIPSAEPFTTNSVLVIPEDVEEGDIVIHSNYEVSGFRIGGAKPTYPSSNYVFVALDDDDVVTSVQQYQVNKWVEVAGRVYIGDDTTENLVGYDMSTFEVTAPEGDSDSSGDSSGSGSGGSSSSGEGLDALLDGIRDIFDTLGSIVGTLLSSISDFLNSAIESLSLFEDFSSGFAGFLGQAFSFIPQEIWSVIGAGITLMIIAAFIKLLKG